MPTRAEQQESLQETLLLLNRVVHAAVTSIVVTDPHLPDNPIVYHNPAFERISGYSAVEIDGHNCRFLQGNETDRDEISRLRAAIATGQPFQGTIRNYRKDGTAFWNDLHVSPVHDENGRLSHFVGVQNDVTRRAEAERERDVLLAQQKRIADTLQRALLLTPNAGDLNGLEIATQYEPAWDEAQFGGDFFDTIALSEDRIALVVGDCTGKGIEAGQYTAEVKYALRVLLREYGHPTPALHRLNSFLMDAQRLDARDRDALVCVLVAVIDTGTGETIIASAGMEPPLIVRDDGRAEPVEAHGMILGMDVAAEYSAHVVTLGEDEYLILATDGITEARGPRPGRSFFGYDGFTEAALSATAELSTLDAMGERIVQSVKNFAADGRPQDDVCLLIARRRPLSRAADAPSPDVDMPSAAAVKHANGDLAEFALEVTGLGYWELNTATGVSRRSVRHDEIFGYGSAEGEAAPPPDWTYQLFLSHIHPEDHARVDALYSRAFAAGMDWHFECRIIRAGDGAVRFIEAQGRHFGAASGTAGAAARVIGTVTDITDRREAERLAKQAADQLRLVTDAAPLLISYVDRDLIYQFVNQGYSEWFGHPKEQVVGRTVREVIGEAAFEASRARIEAVLSGERVSYEAMLPYNEGQNTRHVHADMIPDISKDGHVKGYVAVVVDVTKRREAEKEARERSQEIVATFESMTDAFLALDRDWRCTYVNAEAERLLYRTKDELIGKVFWEEFPQTVDSAFGSGYRKAVREGIPVTVEEYYPPLDGWFEVRAFPSPAGGLSIYFRNITERKRAEQRERFLADLADRTRFSADPEAILYESARLVGEFTGASRALFGDIDDAPGSDPNAATIAVHRDFVQHGAPSIAGMTRPLLSFGSAIIDSLRRGKVTASEDILNDERVLPVHRVAFAELGIRAFLGVPIHVNSRWVSLLVLHHATPRIWPIHERELLVEAAERASLAVENARLQRDQAHGAERLRLAVGAAGLGAWDIDLTTTATICTVDSRTAALFGRATDKGDSLKVEGTNWIEWMHPDDRDRVFREFADALGGDATEYRMEYRALWPDGQTVRWLSALATIRRDAATGRALRVVGMCRDMTEEKEAAQKQRRFLRELLFGMTEGRLRLCDSITDLPPPLPPACDPVELTRMTLRLLRSQVESVTEEMRFAKERVQDLKTAVGEASMNAVKHGGGVKVGRVHTDLTKGVVQVWVRDEGEGIAEHLIHRAVESGWTTGGFGQGFHLMWKTCDRLYLLTGPDGTTVVLEQDRNSPPPSWLIDAL